MQRPKLTETQRIANCASYGKTLIHKGKKSQFYSMFNKAGVFGGKFFFPPKNSFTYEADCLEFLAIFRSCDAQNMFTSLNPFKSLQTIHLYMANTIDTIVEQFLQYKARKIDRF